MTPEELQEKIDAYAPWSNAVLRFSLGTDVTAIDPDTLNVVETEEIITYVAALQPAPPRSNGSAGANDNRYEVKGRLLSPTFFDVRITNGAQAACTLNGMEGRFEVSFDLAMDSFHRASIRQEIRGTFTVIGGPGT